MSVFDLLEEGIKDEQVINLFAKYVALFSQGGRQRMTIEVVEIFENCLRAQPKGRFPRSRKLLREKRAEHRRSMATLDAFLKEIR
jgi:hypothetical protein